MNRIIGIDPGHKISGICMIQNREILFASNEENKNVFKRVKALCDGIGAEIVVEDMQPFRMAASQYIIDTAKFIGEISYRLNTAMFVDAFHLVPRNKVKKWIFESCPDICKPRIESKMIMLDKRIVGKGKKGLRKNDGEMRLPSFHYVDDRIVIAALKELYGIPTPKPGKPNIYGLKDHSWQAAACAFYVQNQ